MQDMHFLQDMLVLFALGIGTVVVFHRINLPPVLGFLLTGLICGPYGFKFVNSVHEVEQLAELGVVLLLFTIGIEFSFAKLRRVKRFLLIGGSLQVLLTIAAATGLAMFVGLPWNISVFLGMLVSLSSTVLVIRLLQEKGEMSSSHGTSALSVLVFQDLCIVPMVLAVPFLGAGGGMDLMSLGWLMGKAVLFVLIAGVLARYLVPWLLDHVANTRKREAFVLSTMLLCLGTGWATSQVGLSLALGAFLAGLIISESKYSHQALSEILPFREVFNFLVFVSIGMLFDARTLLQEPLLIAGCLVALIIVKTLVTSAVTLSFGHSVRAALLTGFTLAQVSEFSFVLAKVGLHEKVWDAGLNQIFLAVAILSMVVTPVFGRLANMTSDLLEKILPLTWTGGRGAKLHPGDEHLKDHVIIIGYEVVGRELARVLKDQKVDYIIVEHDPEIVRSERKNGTPIFYGDAGSQSVLEHASIEDARLIAITVAHPATAIKTTELARRLNPHVHVVARARLLTEVPELIKVGAHEVVPEELAGSIEMFSRVLQNCLIPKPEVDRWVDRVHEEWEQSSRLMYQRLRPGDWLPSLPCKLRVEVHKIPETSIVAGSTLRDSAFRKKTGASVVAIQRANGELLRNPYGTIGITAGDTLIVLGEQTQLAAAAELILTARSTEPVDQQLPPPADELRPPDGDSYQQ